MVKFISHPDRPTFIPDPPPEVHCWIECEGGEINVCAQVGPNGDDQILVSIRPKTEARSAEVVCWGLSDPALTDIFNRRLTARDK